jgi:ribosomal protein L17
MPTISKRLQAFLDEMASDPIEERVVEYVIREVNKGRKLTEALTDPYVKNRLSEERLEGVLENPEIATALEEQITEAFKNREFGFTE